MGTLRASRVALRLSQERDEKFLETWTRAASAGAGGPHWPLVSSASHDVAVEIASFGKAIDGFLERVGQRDSTRNPASSQEFEEASLAQAQLALVNAIRRSTVGKQKTLTVWIGGSQARPDSWEDDQS